MAEHHALWRAGGAGGVLKQCKIARIDRGWNPPWRRRAGSVDMNPVDIVRVGLYCASDLRITFEPGESQHDARCTVLKNGRTSTGSTFPDEVGRRNRYASRVKAAEQGSNEIQTGRKNQHDASAAQAACGQLRRNRSGICIQGPECSLIGNFASMVEEHESELVGLAYRASAKHFDHCRRGFHARPHLFLNEFLYKV